MYIEIENLRSNGKKLYVVSFDDGSYYTVMANENDYPDSLEHKEIPQSLYYVLLESNI